MYDRRKDEEITSFQLLLESSPSSRVVLPLANEDSLGKRIMLSLVGSSEGPSLISPASLL